jgi:hypothetical protein
MKLYRLFSLFWRWDDEKKAQWEELSARGRRHFVLVRGVGVFGVWCFSVMTLMMLASRDVFDASVGFLLLSNLVIWSCAGAIWGEVSWWATSRFYAEQFESRQEASRN